jgi:hypothetical protein
VTAAGEGCKALLDAEKFVKEKVRTVQAVS